MKQSELKHHQDISKNAETIWGWGTAAGQARAHRRAELIKRAGKLTQGNRVLEIGCGTGIFSVQFVAAGIQLVSIDICQELLDQAIKKTPNVNFMIGDAENLSFPDQHFDAVIASSVLHHLDVEKTLKEIWRVLKPGGMLALAEPNMMNPQIMIQKNVPFIKRAMGDSEEETAFFRWPLNRQLQQAGFSTISITPFDFLHPLVPASSISLVERIGGVLEHVPVVKEIAGSLLISAQKPKETTTMPHTTPTKSLLTRFVSLFKKSDIAHTDLNSSDAALLHRKQILGKPFLRSFYDETYNVFVEHAQALSKLPGEILELGSGAGFLKERIPGVITSDVCELPFVDRVIFANQLPFAEGGLKGIFALNVLHHLADAEAFFREADRTLTPGGRIVLIEPHCSWWGRFVYTYLHYEPFDMKAKEWTLEDSGRLETANGALPYIILTRDRERYERLFPRLKIKQFSHHNVLCYLLSGGVSWPALVPSFTYPVFSALDRLLSRASGAFPIFQTIVIEKV